jgi:chorismate mutase
MSEKALSTGGDAPDPVIAELRGQISDLDRSIVEAVNARLELVAQIRRYKASQGLPFLDPAREEAMLLYLTRGNRGPLSEDGLRELYLGLLDLSKREVTRTGEEDA